MEPAPKRPRLDNDETEPAPKRPRPDNAESSSGSCPYTHPYANQRYNEARNSFTGHGVQNSGGTIEIARDMITNNYASAPQGQGEQGGPEERRRALLESLQFAQMDARQMSIKQAHAKTCRWFLKDPEYLQWSKNDGTQSQGSFLWIKGKPGAGKSTLMKFLLKQTRRARSEGIIISFFFNARGEDMEKTTLGLYQSLLVQLLELRPSLQRVLDQFRNGPPQWSVELLEELFEEAVDSLDETSLVCFIDALDECQEQEVRDMIRFLSDLSDIRSRFHVCFASRHYPHITIPKGCSIVLEDKDEHHEDIAKYIGNALHIGGGKLSEQIRSELQEKASGVFMWVVLVVDILNKECDTGQKHTLRNRLRQIPGDLHALFRDILTRDSRNAPGLLLCIQWVLFAMRPLSPRQLYYAVLAGVEPESLADCHTDDITNDDISKFILDKSKGLAESTKSSLPTIQFIHESVRDFLLKDNGLQTIWPGDSAHHEGQSHDTLKQACFSYITCEHVSHAIEVLDLPEKPSKQEDKDRRTDIDGRFPFLEYATQGVLYHADKAQDGTQSQTDFLATFPLAGWVKRYNIFEQHHVRRFTSGVSLLYVLAHENCGALISIQQEDRSCFQVEKERYRTPLFAALCLKCTSAVIALLESQKRHIPRSLLRIFDVPTSPEENWYKVFNRDLRLPVTQSMLLSFLLNIQDEKLLSMFYATEVDPGLRDRRGRFPLSYVAAGKDVKVAEILLERGADITGTDYTSGGTDSGETLLHRASESGTVEMVEFLISRDAPLNLADTGGSTPLCLASKRGSPEIVKLLLEKGANAAGSNKSSSTPLHRAAHEGHIEVIHLLLDHGADLEAEAQYGEMPIHLASVMGHVEVVRLLIERGSSVHACDYGGNTPLHRASVHGRIEVVRQLIETGADIHATTKGGETPINLALKLRRLKVVNLLVAKGANPDTKDKGGKTLLSWASFEGNTEIVTLLLEKGANMEASDTTSHTPLLLAAKGGHEEVVRLLIEKCANVDAKDVDGWTPLLSASSQGYVGIVRRLLEKGANTEPVIQWGRKPLSHALEMGHTEVAKLLIEEGADVNATHISGWTPLFWASQRGDIEVVRMLLERGADPEAPDMCGLKALELAVANGHREVIKLLEEWEARSVPDRVHQVD